MLVVVAMSLFLVGVVGLAIDGSHLYAERQMAQAAADAAAQAAIRSVFTGSNTSGTSGFSTGGSFTCASSDNRTPCYYAQTLNGFNGSLDTVTVDFPSTAAVGVPTSTLSSSDPVNLLRVTISRQVTTTFFKLIGSWTPSVQASATGAIVSIVSPIPSVITHPSIADALSVTGSLTICGGPQQSIQVNSSNAAAFSSGLALACGGPSTTGGDLGAFGGSTTNPGVSLGSTGHYVGPSLPVQDPLAGVVAPTIPATIPPQSGQSCSVLGHCGSCPGGAGSCTEYLPGLYNTVNGINIPGGTAMFDPGIYYINGGGFKTINSTVGMCTSCAADPTTINGMLVYDTGPVSGGCTVTGGFTLDTSSDVFYGAGVSAASLTSTPAAPYYGILFFEDRNACAHTHTIGQGTACFSLIGTVYITNTLAIMTANPAQYQSVAYNGTCSGTQRDGPIIVSKLTVGGNSTMTMGYPTSVLNLRQVALVQ